jgi:hypothetical protein
MSVKVNMLMQEQGANSSGSLTVTRCLNGWPNSTIVDDVVDMPASRVFTFTDGVFSDDVTIEDIGQDGNYYKFMFSTSASFYTVEARLPNNYDDHSIDFADLHFKGAL